MALDENTIRVLISVGTSIIVLPLGIFFGHHLALGRDKRNEYKRLVDPIRLKLIQRKAVDKKEIEELQACLGDKAQNIVQLFESEYLPTTQLDINDGGYNSQGGKVTPDHAQIKINKDKIESARVLLLEACKEK